MKRDIFLDCLIHFPLTVAIIALCATLASAHPPQAPMPPQSPPPSQAPEMIEEETTLAAPFNCGCNGVGNCVCGASCPCVAHHTAASTKTPRPDGEGWQYNTTTGEWWRWVENNARSSVSPSVAIPTAPSFSPYTPAFNFASQQYIAPTVFAPHPIFNAAPPISLRSEGGCANGQCGVSQNNSRGFFRRR